MGKLIKVYSDNTSQKSLREIVTALEKGAIAIYPTDTLYAIGCALTNVKGIAQIKKMKGKEDNNLSILCNDIQCAAKYARIDNASFKLLRGNTPAPVTYIMSSTGSVPAKFIRNKNSVGIRIPNNPIVLQIVEMLGMPLVSTSLPTSHLDEVDLINPELLWEEYGDRVDIFIDGGMAHNSPSTVVELEKGEITIIRQGEYYF